MNNQQLPYTLNAHRLSYIFNAKCLDDNITSVRQKSNYICNKCESHFSKSYIDIILKGVWCDVCDKKTDRFAYHIYNKEGNLYDDFKAKAIFYIPYRYIKVMCHYLTHTEILSESLLDNNAPITGTDRKHSESDTMYNGYTIYPRQGKYSKVVFMFEPPNTKLSMVLDKTQIIGVSYLEFKNNTINDFLFNHIKHFNLIDSDVSVVEFKNNTSRVMCKLANRIYGFDIYSGTASTLPKLLQPETTAVGYMLPQFPQPSNPVVYLEEDISELPQTQSSLIVSVSSSTSSNSSTSFQLFSEDVPDDVILKIPDDVSNAISKVISNVMFNEEIYEIVSATPDVLIDISPKVKSDVVIEVIPEVPNLIVDLQEKYKNKYSYDKWNSKLSDESLKNIIPETVITITCIRHNNDFEQSISRNQENKVGCSACRGENIFIGKTKKVPNLVAKYDLDKLLYMNPTNPIKVSCKQHGEFTVNLPSEFLKEIQGCPQCN